MLATNSRLREQTHEYAGMQVLVGGHPAAVTGLPGLERVIHELCEGNELRADAAKLEITLSVRRTADAHWEVSLCEVNALRLAPPSTGPQLV